MPQKLDNRVTKREVVWKKGQLFLNPGETIYYATGLRAFFKRWKKKIKWIFRKFSSRQKEMFLFSIGGRVNSEDRWKIDGLPPVCAKITYKSGLFFLTPGISDHLMDFSKHGISLKGEKGIVKQLIMGQTCYRVKFDDQSLTLFLVAGIDTFTKEQKIPEISSNNIKQVFTELEWSGSGLSFKKWFLKHLLISSGCILSVLACLTVVFLHHQFFRGSKRYTPQSLWFKLLTLFSALLTGLFTVVMWWTGDAGIQIQLFIEWLSWTAATLFIAFTYKFENELGLLWLCALFLCGSGTLSLLQLGAGADNLTWLSYARKHIIFMTIFAVFIQVLNLCNRDIILNSCINFISNDGLGFKLLRAGLVTTALGFMFLQWLFGGENGLWNFQPAEGAKLFFIITSAFVGLHLGELRRHNSDLYQQKPLKYLFDVFWVFILFCLALFAVFIGVDDMSPMVIMGVLFLSWLWKVSPHPWQLTSSHKFWRTIILLLIIIILFFGNKFHSNPEKVPDWIPQKDRFQVWADPDKHPHTGAQVLKSMELAGLGGWFGAEPSWFGKNRSVYRLPAVQDDFIVSYILYKFGGCTGIILAFIQMLYILTLLRISALMEIWAEESGVFRKRYTGKVMSIIVFGLAWVHIAQWTISWADALGLLPVMGQPMTWISSANSHMLFVGFPTLIFSVISIRCMYKE